MKKLARFLTLLFLMNVSFFFTATTTSAQVSVSLQLFYDELSPFGEWINIPDYGYAWIPGITGSFSPYQTAGHWVFTDYGWTWVSDYAWGWAPFHYGRWYYHHLYRWIWIPGIEWAPAWVVWASADGYYGWAPMAPGVTITFMNYPVDHWIFVKSRHFGSHNLSHHYVNRSRNVRIINNITVINNTREDRDRQVTYPLGPRREDVQRVTHRSVNEVALRESDKPDQHADARELRIYKPRIQQDAAGEKSAPRNLTLKKIDTPPDKRDEHDRLRTEQQPIQNIPDRTRSNEQRREETRQESRQDQTIRDQNMPDRTRKTEKQTHEPYQAPNVGERRQPSQPRNERRINSNKRSPIENAPRTPQNKKSRGR